MATNVRELALDCLLMVEKKECAYKEALNMQLVKNQFLSKQDRAFLTKLVNGSVEYKLRLEYVINQYSNTPINKCKPLIRVLLKMSAYQILFLDKVPDSAACNEAVKLAKKRGFSRLSGFVNGVLRNLARNKDEIKYPDKGSSNYLSVYYSTPEWIVDLIVKQYGYELAKDIIINSLDESRLYAYINCQKTSIKDAISSLNEEGVNALSVKLEKQYIASEVETAFSKKYTDKLAHRYEERAIVLEEVDYLTRYESFKKGLFTVQDLSSMLVGFLAEAIINEELSDNLREINVLDMCSAPGSKALYIALSNSDKVNLISRDLTEFKTDLIKENVDRLEVNNIKVEVLDATKLVEDDIDSKDIVVLDAPCSGLGVIKRKKDIKYNIEPKQLDELAAIQKAMLNNAAKYVKLDGYLIYSTCTINKDENTNQINEFLKSNSNYELLYERQSLQTKENSLSDGFYIAVLKRR
ncbi:MAG: 16S rRNA (cytosine(967)-C(5))-methyltransferase RsmB [Lachnospiraceae bacterium]|nr:16S rRNA (cytosine(967)-C(5))-methyltransferase RsmB [Lachnospiraceae bacterium]